MRPVILRNNKPLNSELWTECVRESDGEIIKQPNRSEQKTQSTRYHGNDNQTQMVLGWLFGENNRQPFDNLLYVRDTPAETHLTEELRPR